MGELSARELDALRWLENDRVSPRAGDIFSHSAAIGALRDKGLARRRRRPGWTQTVLTKAGHEALAAARKQEDGDG